MLVVVFALFVFAVMIYVYAVRALDEPEGTRWLWLAMVVAGGCALATDDEHVPKAVKIAAYVLAATLFVLFHRARRRARPADA